VRGVGGTERGKCIEDGGEFTLANFLAFFRSAGLEVKDAKLPGVASEIDNGGLEEGVGEIGDEG